MAHPEPEQRVKFIVVFCFTIHPIQKPAAEWMSVLFYRASVHMRIDHSCQSFGGVPFVSVLTTICSGAPPVSIHLDSS